VNDPNGAQPPSEPVAPFGQPSRPTADDTAAAPATAAPATLPTDDAAVLESLEADLVAVEEAVHTLDRIAADGVGGVAAADQITSVVSAARFPDGAPVTEVDLTGT
jgi:hypothetical protein